MENEPQNPISPPEEAMPAPPPPTYIMPAEYPAERRGSGCLWGLAGMFACLSIPLLAIVLAVIVGATTFNSVIDGLVSIFRPQPQTATVFSTQTLVNSVLPLGQLVSISVQLAKADISINVNAGALNACGRSAQHVAQGTVEAGIDLMGFDESKVAYSAETDTYTLTVPAPRLTSCRIDYIRQYNRSSTACNVDWDEERLLASYVSLRDFRDDAVEGGILERAKDETRTLLVNFAHALTGSDIQIVFEEGDPQSFPASCDPPAPQGWNFDASANAWIKR